MLREKYCRMMEQAVPDEALVRRTVDRAGQGRRRKRIRPAVALLAAAVAAALLAVPVAATASEPFREVLYAVSPSTAQYFMPVQRECVNNGIRMAVEAAYVRGSTAGLYVTLEDLEGDRVDESCDLFDSYDIRSPYSTASGCTMVDYDAQNRRATFLITIDRLDGQPIRGGKITFSVGRFLSHKKTYEGVEIPVALDSLGAARTESTGLTGGSGDFTDDTELALVPGTAQADFPVPGFSLSAIGYVDGKLHVQTMTENRLQYDNHGWLYLLDENGQEVESDGSFDFRRDKDDGQTEDYMETVFSVPEEDIGSYRLCGTFVTCDTLTEGGWSVTFPMENSAAE